MIRQPTAGVSHSSTIAAYYLPLKPRQLDLVEERHGATRYQLDLFKESNDPNHQAQ
jgi:hypothetical protein